jgi:mxaD protein
MKYFLAAACVALAINTGVAAAAAPTLHVSKTMTFNAPADKVWSTVKNFDGWAKWHPALASDEIVEGKNNTVGAVRVLTLKGGGTIKERLNAYNESGRVVRYSIVESVLPVSSYSSTLTVKAAGPSKSVMTWSGHFKRKNTAAAPADNENDKAAVDAITGVYTSGLDAVKKLVE